ncbi:MAG: hypothetical protein ABI895_00080 [Deltaproteobacteria bacterium]
MKLALVLCGPLALTSGCAHLEADGPAAPAAPAAAPAATPANAPETTLRVASGPIESLRSPYFSAFEVTFQNPSSQWHTVRRVSIGPERQLFGPALESLVGERLRAWQLAAREAAAGQEGPRHPALETLAPEAPAKTEPGGAEAAAAAGPPSYLLTCPFTIAPGLFTRKWIVLYAAAADALLGQDLMLSYELESGKVERVLVQYPKPAPKP